MVEDRPCIFELRFQRLHVIFHGLLGVGIVVHGFHHLRVCKLVLIGIKFVHELVGLVAEFIRRLDEIRVCCHGIEGRTQIVDRGEVDSKRLLVSINNGLFLRIESRRLQDSEREEPTRERLQTSTS